jgi:hypothetical protein
MVHLPQLPSDHEETAKELIRRVDGDTAVDQFNCLCLSGWDGKLADSARLGATPPVDAAGNTKGTRVDVTP